MNTFNKLFRKTNINSKHNINYIKINEVNTNHLLTLLNTRKVREHLIEHDLFNDISIKDWIDMKMKIDSTHGCIIRAILIDTQLGGWCGIQLEDNKYEIAVVIDQNYWGLGNRIFQDIMSWAKDLGHKTVYIHLLHTRPESKYLKKISKNVYQSKVLDSKFTTYELAVN